MLYICHSDICYHSQYGAYLWPRENNKANNYSIKGSIHLRFLRGYCVQGPNTPIFLNFDFNYFTNELYQSKHRPSCLYARDGSWCVHICGKTWNQGKYLKNSMVSKLNFCLK